MQSRIEEARTVLLKTYDNTKEVDKRLAEIQIAARIANTEKYKGKVLWLKILNSSPAIIRILITGCGIQCFQQISGIDATVYYSLTIFKDVGIKGNTELLAATVAVGFTKTMFILVAIFLIDKLGRKPLLYISKIRMTISLFCLSFTLTFLEDQRFGIGLAILFICLNVAFFSVRIGLICWVVSSKIFPLRLRAQASGLGAVGSRASSGIICMSFLTLSRAITVGGTFFLFSVISALSVLFFHTCVPETKGKSLEQIEMLFQKGRELQVGGEIEMGDAECLVQRQ
ncbi:hypothetical protein J1N35_018392 [Gossypium stocksii]|uniref:Major facilitator superfamily (MFS) profile domain-containing protein n=1 Tax=Gossypium stocksii TaxID=47602 RepID=A0A9D4A717_9ROSI|nr:hypothetical protein J1N35_018392 [Gossypium stocksii]